MVVMTSDKTQLQRNYVPIAKREIESFLGATAFKGLQFIKLSAHWTESLFWIVLIIGATALAIRDVHKVCADFANEETFTSMRVNGLQRLTIHGAIVCVEYDAHTLNLSDPLLLRYANTSKINDLASRVNCTSAIEFLSRSLKLLTVIHLIEIGRTADYERKVAELENGEKLHELHDSLRAERLSISNLSSIVGNWLCNSALIKIDTIKRGALLASVNPCHPANISWLGVVPYIQIMSSRTSMCVDIDGKVSFGSMLDRVLISVAANISGLSSEFSGRMLHSILDFSGDPVSTDMSKDYITFPTNGCSAYEVGIDAEMRLLDRRVASCNREADTRLRCYGDCEVALYASTKECNCTQLTWRYLYATSPTMCFDEQTIEEHIACRHASKKAPNTIDACWETCLFPCKHKQMVIVTIAQGCYDEHERSRKDRASIELIPKRFTVPVFEEQFSVHLSDLFSSIGGTCGLWLGVGMLGICHALLFPLKLLVKLLRTKNDTRTAPIEFDERF